MRATSDFKNYKKGTFSNLDVPLDELRDRRPGCDGDDIWDTPSGASPLRKPKS